MDMMGLLNMLDEYGLLRKDFPQSLAEVRDAMAAADSLNKQEQKVLDTFTLIDNYYTDGVETFEEWEEEKAP